MCQKLVPLRWTVVCAKSAAVTGRPIERTWDAATGFYGERAGLLQGRLHRMSHDGSTELVEVRERVDLPNGKSLPDGRGSFRIAYMQRVRG